MLQQQNKLGHSKKMIELYRQYCANLTQNSSNTQWLPREYWQMLQYWNRNGPTLDREATKWPHTVLTAVGNELYQLILKDVVIQMPTSG